VAVGAVRRPVLSVPPAAAELAVRAAAAAGADLAGVDLLPLPDGGWTVLELNGAVDFSPAYALGGADVFGTALSLLLLAAGRKRMPETTFQTPARPGLNVSLLEAEAGQPTAHDEA
jgi:hypothetical protein